nr:MAG TPA: hypothetical protein [Caudoviricetes sp.]
MYNCTRRSGNMALFSINTKIIIFKEEKCKIDYLC